VELRAFEMPPQRAAMSLTQQLLLRALIARFLANIPGPAPRSFAGGTELHDRFMLPHFIELDFHDVIEDLQGAGYPLKAEMVSRRISSFRFPPVTEVSTSVGVSLENPSGSSRPWHVLGEERARPAAPSGTWIHRWNACR